MLDFLVRSSLEERVADQRFKPEAHIQGVARRLRLRLTSVATLTLFHANPNKQLAKKDLTPKVFTGGTPDFTRG